MIKDVVDVVFEPKFAFHDEQICRLSYARHKKFKVTDIWDQSDKVGEIFFQKVRKSLQRCKVESIVDQLIIRQALISKLTTFYDDLNIIELLVTEATNDLKMLIVKRTEPVNNPKPVNL